MWIRDHIFSRASSLGVREYASARISELGNNHLEDQEVR